MPKTKKVVTEVVAKKKKKPPYSLQVRVNDVEFKTNAEDLTSALTEFVASPEFPLGAKTLAVLTYSKGDKEGRQIWQTPKARRMFRIIGLKPDALAVLGARLEAELL